MGNSVGLIAEDRSDIEVIKTLIEKIVPNRKPSYSQRSGGGCGRVMRKATSWAEDLYRVGCNLLIIFHDLDRKNFKELESSLKSKIKDCLIKYKVVVIPIEEIEAWLLTDSEAIE